MSSLKVLDSGIWSPCVIRDMFSLKSKRGSHAFLESGAIRITGFACPVWTNLCLSLFCRVFSSLPVSVSSHSVRLFEQAVPTLLSSWKNTSHWAYPYLMGPIIAWLYLQRPSFQIPCTRVKACAHIIQRSHLTTHKSWCTPWRLILMLSVLVTSPVSLRQPELFWAIFLNKSALNSRKRFSLDILSDSLHHGLPRSRGTAADALR